MAEVMLKFDGRAYAYWQRMEIHDSVDDLCTSVHLGLSSPDAVTPLDLTPNTLAQVMVGGDLVATVRADMIVRQVGDKSHALTFAGRSIARELVDCQFSATYKGLHLGEVVKRICAAFKVPVKTPSDTPLTPNFSMQCEVPANALINAARAANRLLYPQPDGGLILTTPTTDKPVASLAMESSGSGRIKAYSVIDEYRLRFSDYTVKGYDYANNRALKGAVRDTGITFFRPLHVLADKFTAGPLDCGQRALLERNRRLARSHRIDMLIQGWRHAAGGVWAVNTQVRVVLPAEGVDDVFLIGDRTLILDADGGETTRLRLMHRDAFTGYERRNVKRGGKSGR